jgi:hypothetical protein
MGSVASNDVTKHETSDDQRYELRPDLIDPASDDMNCDHRRHRRKPYGCGKPS